MKKTTAITCLFMMAVLTQCKKDKTTPVAPNPNLSEVVKPSGVFSSAGSTNTTVMGHPESRGALVRVFWKDIEATEGNFNFTNIDIQVNAVKNKGKKYSLAILAGGIGSPDWLITSKGGSFL